MISKKSSINRSYWENMTSEELDLFAKQIFTAYRERCDNFPEYNLDQEERTKEYFKLKKYDRSGIIEDGVVKQTNSSSSYI
jgi:hypothetical protein